MRDVVDIGAYGTWRPAQRLVEAEIDTGAALERLGPGWHVLHSLPVGPGPATLAHLVIGPRGVFAITSMPHGATVVDVLDGQAQLSSYGGDHAVAEVRQLAQRVSTGLRHRLGRAYDVPRVDPLLCLTDGGPAGHRPDQHAEVVPLPHLLAHLGARPRRLTAAQVQRLLAVAGEPSTWDAPGSEWFVTDLAARYDAVVRSGADPPHAARQPDDDERVLSGVVTACDPPQFEARTAGLRVASVLLLLLGMASVGTFGLLSLPTLAFGALLLRHYGGWGWLNAKDASLVLVGMVMAALPGLFWLLMLPVVLAATA